MSNAFSSFLLALLILVSCNNAPIENNTDTESFTLEATLTNIPDSTLFYLKDPTSTMLDSAYVVNGKLALSSQLKTTAPQKLTLYTIEPEFIYTLLLVGNDQVTFKADKSDFPWNIDLSGSVHQDEAEKFNQIEFQRQRLSAALRSNYEQDEALLSEQLKRLSDSLDHEIIQLLKANFNSYAALNRFKYYKDAFSTKELSALYAQLDDALKETVFAKAVKLQSEFPKPEVGDPYYDYRATNQYGNTVALSDTKDKYLLLHFSSLACYGSQLSLPELKALHNKYPDALDIVSISADLDQELWKNHVKRDSITWNYLWDGKGDYSDACIKYWEKGTPNYVLIAPDRTILERWWGYREGLLKETVGKHLNT